VLRSRLALAESPTWPLKEFTLNGKKFHDTRLGEWTGFYDWLRDSNGGLLGVRYWLSEGTELLEEHARVLTYTKVDPSRHIEVYFSERKDFDANLSADQEFLYDPVFRSDDGSYALGFAMDGLSESDIRNLENAQADWIAFESLA